jgi:hypothetical protein
MSKRQDSQEIPLRAALLHALISAPYSQTRVCFENAGAHAKLIVLLKTIHCYQVEK